MRFVAQRVEVVLVDDVDGGPADETVQFALDGVSYEIDLNAANATALREALAVCPACLHDVSRRKCHSRIDVECRSLLGAGRVPAVRW